MPLPRSEFARAVLEAVAALLCLFSAGASLACLQSGLEECAGVLAWLAVGVPTLALSLRLARPLAGVMRRLLAGRAAMTRP